MRPEAQIELPTVTMVSMKRYLFLAMLSVAAVVVFNLVNFALQSPIEADQLEIEKCWEESQGINLAPEKRQTVIGACQALEKAFQLNHGTKVSPGPKDV